MASQLLDTDLSALFGIEIDSATTTAPAAPIAQILCSKCNGRGKFVSYTGRVVGNCFYCNGDGLAPSAAKPIQAGDCTKCAGTGEWRPGRPCFACNSTGKEATTTRINVDAIATAFAAARSHGIKSPKLRLSGFVFSRAPDHGANAGSIYVKSESEYLGKVTAGQFRPSFACLPTTKDQIIAAASDPHSAAKAYGLRTGECSCCGRTLTKGESIDLGIGPICRSKFGWAV